MFKYLFIFSIFSLVGWILEFLYRSVSNKKIINPGFMGGCVVPLYGFGAIIITLLCDLIEKSNFDNKILILFICSTVLLSLLEFITGLIMLKIFRIRLWDYTNSILNFKGFVSLGFSIIWGILAVLFYKFVYFDLFIVLKSMENSLIWIFVLGMYYGIFLIDLSITLNLFNTIKNYSKDLSKIINLEKLKMDVIGRVTHNKLLNTIYPYVSIRRFIVGRGKKK